MVKFYHKFFSSLFLPVKMESFFSGIPILGTLIAMWVMRNYDLTEDKAREIKEALATKKGEL